MRCLQQPLRPHSTEQWCAWGLTPRNVHGSQSSLFPGCVDPCQVTEVRIHRSTNHLAVEFLKFFHPITESNDLRGAHKGKIKRVKEEHHIFSSVVRKADIFELTIWHNSCSFEVGGRVPNFSIS